MKNYNFKKFESKYVKGVDCLYLYKTNLRLSPKAFEKLGSPRSVDIYIDEQNNSIKITQGVGRKVAKNRCIGTSALSKIMPLGRYVCEGKIYKNQEEK